MKVLLINPPREKEIVGNNPTIIEEERGYNPPLGLLYVGAYLEREGGGHELKIIDSQVEELSYGELRRKIEEYGPELVGLTAMTMTVVDVYETVGMVKELNPETRVVLGGPHVYLFPEETLENPNVDILVLGEGEVTFTRLVACLEEGGDLRQIPGLVFREGKEIVRTEAAPVVEDLDALPHPARHLTPYEKYSSLLAKRNPVTTIFTSRGCPFQCSFCDRPHLGKRFRARSAMNVVDEMEQCVKMGIHEFLVYDDTFTIQEQRVLDFCDEIIRRKLDVGFDIRARVDTVNEVMLKKLKEAGCQGIHYGVEAGTEKILTVLNKRISLPLVQEVFRQTKRQKIPILAYFMIGNPEETFDDIKATFSVIKKLEPDYVHITILTPFPGTKIYFDGLRSGVLERDYWREFSRNPEADFIPPHWGEYFSREALSHLLVQGYKGFYIRPSYIARSFLKLGSFEAFVKKAKAGLKVFGMR